LFPATRQVFEQKVLVVNKQNA